MLPSRHIIASLSLGAGLGFLSESALAGLLCFLSGILIDVDHVLEYIIQYGFRDFNFKEIYQTCRNTGNSEQSEKGFKKLYLVLHAGEIVVLLWIIVIFTKNLFLLSIALGYTGHLALDMVGKTMRPEAIFATWRMKNNFSTVKLVRGEKWKS